MNNNSLNQCRLWIEQLNQHYGLTVELQANKTKPVYFTCQPFNASCDYINMTIYIPNRYKVLHDPRVVAHEYAHLLSSDHVEHNKQFEQAYKECCLVLGLFYIPTEQLREIIYKNHSLQNTN